MQSKATTVEKYLAELPADRRAALTAVRKVIRANLDRGFEEGMQYGMIGYYVPHRLFPAGYHCDPKQPLPFAGLASQKQYMSLYVPGVYDVFADGRPVTEYGVWFEREWTKGGRKLDMGKCCIRFKRIEDLSLELIGDLFSRYTAQSHVESYQRARAAHTPKSRAEIKKLVADREAAVKKSKRRAT